MVEGQKPVGPATAEQQVACWYIILDCLSKRNRNGAICSNSDVQIRYPGVNRQIKSAPLGHDGSKSTLIGIVIRNAADQDIVIPLAIEFIGSY